MLRSVKSYGLRQGHPQRISGDIHCGVCVFLAISQGIESHRTGRPIRAEAMTGAIHFVLWSKPTRVGRFWFFHVPSFPQAGPDCYPCGFQTDPLLRACNKTYLHNTQGEPSSQKFSISHMLAFVVQLSNAKRRPSGDGCTNASPVPPVYSHNACALP
jgi:hypothetical protein